MVRQILRYIKRFFVRQKNNLSIYAGPDNWRDSFEVLRKKWVEVPAGNTHYRTDELLVLPDNELFNIWQSTRKFITEGEQFSHRGWYHALYKEVFKGKKVLEIGSGLGVDALTFAQHGAYFTCTDIVESNIELLKRLARALGIKDIRFLYIKDIESFKSLDCDYDAVFASGSLHHAPFEILKEEVKIILEHLPIGGRWIQLAYPKKRWVEEGRPPFSEWGRKTDGVNTPWAEWYDLPKLLKLLSPAKFEIVLNLEIRNGEFIWFDLLRLA